jgi:hypothetical protein
LFCHSLGGIVPFPANHEDREVEECTDCHRVEEP